MRSALSLICVLLLFTGASRAADELGRWSREHSEAHKKLDRILTASPKFQEDFTACVEENPKLMNQFIEFLAAKGDRNTNDFVDKYGKEAHLIKRLHEKYPEHVRDFRIWIRDNERAATDLAQIKDGLRRVCKGEAPREEDRDSRKDKKKKD